MTLKIGPRMVFEEAPAPEGDSGGGGSIGGGGDVPPAEPPAEPAPPVQVAFPDNWKEGLPEDLRNDPSLGVINDIPGLAKSYVHAQQQVGRDKIVIPDKHATDDDWKNIYHRLGLPKQFEEYEVKNPEGAEFDDGVVTTLKKAAFEQGILPRQFEGLLNVFSDQQRVAMEDYEKQLEVETNKKMGVLKQDWGQSFQQNAALVQAIVEDAATKMEMSDEVKSFMNNAIVDGVQLGNHPTFLKMFHYFSRFMGEDQLPQTPFQSGGQTRQEVQSRINEIMGNAEHPYHDARHPNHKAAVDEVQALFRELHPGPNPNDGSQQFQSSF